MSDKPAASNFIRTRIDAHLKERRFATRRWAGAPGKAEKHRAGELDQAAIRTRFPPEPNGFLHIGHAKAICLNFGIAQDYQGRCHLRFDDTNPAKEEQRYVDAIVDTIQWLGYSWQHGEDHDLYFASNYFDYFYEFAEYLISAGHAYVDSQDAEAMRANRGTLKEAGVDSPYRTRSADENLKLFREMRAGQHANGTHILRARISMASPNMNLRDPALYRIRHESHHRTGDAWPIYPMYDFAHPIEDALENITHSLCSLEFQDHRPVYEWVLKRLAEGGFFDQPLPQQIEFARLNLEYTVMSKRKFQQLIEGKHVSGWDDPRMPTIAGLRRRGYTPQSIQLFCERIGVAKADTWIDYGVLEQALRDDLDDKAPRATAVLDPVKLALSNWPADQVDTCNAPVHQRHPDRGTRTIEFGRELWIERADFSEDPPKGYFRLFPGNRVRLRYGHVIECTGCEKDADGKITKILANVLDDSKSGTPGADQYKVKGNIHWLPVASACAAKIRLYDRLFSEPRPDAGGKDFIDAINPSSGQVIDAYIESGARNASPEQPLQFERHGYFVADPIDHSTDSPIFNRAVTLKDTWNTSKGKKGKKGGKQQ